MELQKISITPHGMSGFNVLFNPSQYTIAKTNQIQDVGIPGLSAPILQYIHGNARTLNMELFFDTYEEQTDVSELTDQIYELLEIQASTHVPPICDIRWGQFFFTGILENVSGNFTLFLADGTPVRATLTVSFKEYLEVAYLVQRTMTQSVDHRKSYVIKHGDRIDLIAAAEYGDPQKWRLIAEANELESPGYLEPGKSLTLPAIR